MNMYYFACDIFHPNLSNKIRQSELSLTIAGKASGQRSSWVIRREEAIVRFGRRRAAARRRSADTNNGLHGIYTNDYCDMKSYRDTDTEDNCNMKCYSELRATQSKAGGTLC